MDKFCSECGGLIDPNTGVCTNCHKQAYVPNDDNASVASVTGKKKPNIKMILLIIGLALLLLLGGFFAYKLLGSGGKKKEKVDYSKRIETSYYSDGDQMSVSTYEYDKKGNMISVEYESDYYHYHQEGDYDKNDNLIEVRYYDDDGELTDTYSREITYDRKKNMTSYEEYYGDEFSGSAVFEYDKKGNMISAEYYDENDKLTSRYEYTYDKKGNTLSEEYYGSSDKLQSTYLYEYDKKGNMILQEYYDSSGNLSSYYEYEYDKNNRMTLQNVYTGKELDYYMEYEYDKKGREIGRYSFDPDGTASWYTESEYED